MSELKAIFEDIAAGNKWLNPESRSGDGSTLAYTRHLREQLAIFAETFEIRTLFDAPCGDFNWMKAVKFPDDLVYIGGDIVASLIEANRTKYARKSREFIEFDIVADKFPEADVWFCRDCLFHLSNQHILR